MTKIALSSGPMVVTIVVFAVVFVELRVVVAFFENCLCGSWDRVITMTSPWVTFQYSADGQVKPFEYAMSAECFKRILGTCRGEST